jgi:hypothetical protein
MACGGEFPGSVSLTGSDQGSVAQLAMHERLKAELSGNWGSLAG